MATHSSILSERTPWTEEPGRLQSVGSQRVGQDLAIEQQQQSVDDQYKFYICEDVYKIGLTVIYTFSCREPIFFCLDTFTLCVCVYIYTQIYIYTHTYTYIHIYTPDKHFDHLLILSHLCALLENIILKSILSGQLIFDKGTENTQWRRQSLQ